MKVEFEMEGLTEIMAQLRQLPEKVQKKATKPALRAAAQVIKKAAKRNLSGAPVGVRTGLLRKYVSVVSLRDKPGQPTAVLVGVPKKTKILDAIKSTRKGFKPHWKPFYWLFLERGTKNMRARPWLRPAVFSSKAEIQANMVAYYEAFFRTVRFTRK